MPQPVSVGESREKLDQCAAPLLAHRNSESVLQRITPIPQLRFDYDTTTTRLRRKIDMFIFCSRRMEVGARDTS